MAAWSRITRSNIKNRVRKLLLEQCDAFARNPSDIGDTSDFQIEIKLSDQTLINESSRWILRKLYEEVKNYIDYLITNEWVKKNQTWHCKSNDMRP